MTPGRGGEGAVHDARSPERRPAAEWRGCGARLASRVMSETRPFNIGAGLGPTVGGVASHLTGYRASLLINSGLLVVSAAVFAMFARETLTARRGAPPVYAAIAYRGQKETVKRR